MTEVQETDGPRVEPDNLLVKEEAEEFSENDLVDMLFSVTKAQILCKMCKGLGKLMFKNIAEKYIVFISSRGVLAVK